MGKRWCNSLRRVSSQSVVAASQGPATQTSVCHRNKQGFRSMTGDADQGDTSGGLRCRQGDRFRCGLDDEFPKRSDDLRPSRALEPDGPTIPEGNAYPSPGLPSGALATPGGRPPNGAAFLKGMHRGTCFRLGSPINAPSSSHHTANIALPGPTSPGPTQSAAPRKHAIWAYAIPSGLSRVWDCHPG